MTSMEVRHAQRLSPIASPRLQQAVRLLQMPSVEFAALLRDSVSSNPFLESDADFDSENGGVNALDVESDDIDHDNAAAAQVVTESPIDAHPAVQSVDAIRDRIAASGDDRDLWLAEAARDNRLGHGHDGQTSVLDSMAVQTTLCAHLHSQLNLSVLPARDLVLAHVLVESLDDDGYLRSALEEVASTAGLQPPATSQEVQLALNRIQALDPAGVGARDLAECLRLQLPDIVCPSLRALARSIVGHHIELLAAHDSARLADALCAPLAQVAAACDAIRHLDPHPGWRIGSQPVHYVVPDVIAKKVRGQWVVSLNPAVVPRVRLHQVYAALFKRHRSPDNHALATHLQEARWTLRNVEQRFATILQVAQAIVRRQHLFFELGCMAMKPLGLRQIAAEVGVHESTVSRVTSNKYIASPVGVFELKYFFSRVMVSANGSACSGTAIRGLIEEMIRGEDAKAPLSDVEINRQLAQQGLTLARRTVTKYRRMLRIEAVEMRRRRQA